MKNKKVQINYNINTIADALSAKGIFTYKGFTCLISIDNLNPTGYIVLDNKHHQRLANNHTTSDDDYDWPNFKYEITFDDIIDGQRVIGFDTAHVGDYIPLFALNREFHYNTSNSEDIRYMRLPEDEKVWTVYDVKDVLCDMVDYMVMGMNLHPNNRKMAWLNNSKYALGK